MQNTTMANHAGDPAPASQDEIALYLDLMKRVLLDMVYADDPLAPFVLYRPKSQTTLWKRRAIAALESLLAQYRIRLVEPQGHSVLT